MDDNSNSSAASVAFRGVTSIAAGQSVIFFESTATASATDAAITSLFNSTWGASFVFGVNIGAYGGSGIGLNTMGDALNIYDSAGVLQANVVFGASPGASPFATFNNAALLNNATIATLSVAGTNGAFLRTNAGISEIGSPGTIGTAAAPVPEPGTSAAIGIGIAALALFTRRRAAPRAAE